MIASGGGAAVTATTASNQSLQFDLPEFFKKWRKKPPSQFRQFRQIQMNETLHKNTKPGLNLIPRLWLGAASILEHVFFFYFLPLFVPPADTVPILQRQRMLYFKGHLGLQNCCITDICSWQFLWFFNCMAGPSSNPILVNKIFDDYVLD